MAGGHWSRLLSPLTGCSGIRYKTHMSRILALLFLLVGSGTASAHALDGLQACGVKGTRFRVESSRDPLVPNGEYLLVKSMQPVPDCDRWDWIFLQDRELFQQMSRLLGTNNQLILSAVPEIVHEGLIIDIYAMAMQAETENLQDFQPPLDLHRNALLMTPRTTLYHFYHERKHIGDYLSRSRHIAVALSGLELPQESLEVVQHFIMETSAYAEQFRRLSAPGRDFEFAYQGGHAILKTNGLADRQNEMALHREIFRNYYARPMRSYLDLLRQRQPQLARRLTQAMIPFISPIDLARLNASEMFPEFMPCLNSLM